MNILHLYPNIFSGDGTSHQTRQLLKYQSKLGHSVTVVTAQNRSSDFHNCLDANVKVEIIRHGIGGTYRFGEILKAVKPDVVHFTGTWTPMHQLCLLVVLQGKFPFVVSPHGNFSPYALRVRFNGKTCRCYHILAKILWQKCLDVPFLKLAAGVHCHSEYEAELLSNIGIKRSFVAPVGVDSEWVVKSSVSKTQSSQPTTFLHLGRLDIYHKGLDIILTAIESLLEDGIDDQQCNFIFIGPTVNNSREVLQRRAADFGNRILTVRDAVWGEQKKEVLREADYFLNMYRFAGMALAPCEAIGNGLPLVASRESNFGDWVSSAEMGFVVPLEGSQLYKVFKQLIALPTVEYRRISANAMHFAKTNTWLNSAQKVVEGYNKVLS